MCVHMCTCAHSVVCILLYSSMYMEVKENYGSQFSFSILWVHEIKQLIGPGGKHLINLLRCHCSSSPLYFETGRLWTWASLGWASWVAETIGPSEAPPHSLHGLELGGATVSKWCALLGARGTVTSSPMVEWRRRLPREWVTGAASMLSHIVAFSKQA